MDGLHFASCIKWRARRLLAMHKERVVYPLIDVRCGTPVAWSPKFAGSGRFRTPRATQSFLIIKG
jgi:hypothetical protein